MELYSFDYTGNGNHFDFVYDNFKCSDVNKQRRGKISLSGEKFYQNENLQYQKKLFFFSYSDGQHRCKQ
jgi:hypothetical protein